jgi:hypothetical protein
MRQHIYRKPVDILDTAEIIKNLAGLESGIVPGVSAGITPGTSGTLTQKNGYALVSAESTFTNDTDKTSGDGSENNPYLFENFLFDNTESETFFLNFQQASCDYFVKFKNCKFTGYTTGIVRFQGVSNTGALIFENCEFVAASGWVTEQRNAADIIIDKCLVSDCASVVPWLHIAGWTGSLTITDTRCDDSSGAWGPTSAAFGTDGGDMTGTIDIDRCEVVCATPGNIYSGIRISNTFGSFTIDNLLVSACDYGISDNGDDNGGAGHIKNSRFQNMLNENVNLRSVDGVILEHCEFNDTPAGKRLVYFLSDHTATPTLTKWPKNCHILYCKGTKTTGTFIAGNEGFEFLDGENCSMKGCYITNCPEDALEFVRPQGDCYMEDCVIENIVGQGVDIYRTQDVNSPGRMFVKNIFGTNVSDYGVICETVNHAHLENILIDNSAGTRPLVRTWSTSTNVTLSGFSSSLDMIGDGTNAIIDDGDGTHIVDASIPYSSTNKNRTSRE